ncbi:MAG: CcmD family protein [Bacteroidota bacterium]
MRYVFTFLLFCASLHSFVFAQAQQPAESADPLRADGKIYVVVVMVAIVLAGFFAYLFLLDRKIKKVEGQVKEKNQ